MPDLGHLRVFLAVAQHRNFTRAAQQLHFTQQTISKSIAALEADLGVRLLERTTREVELTAAGDALRANGASALKAVDDAFRRAKDVGNGLAGTIHVAVTPGVGTALHPDIAAAITEGAPDLQVRIHEGRFAEAEAGLRRREFDLIITRTGVVPLDLEHAELAPTPAIIIVPAGHPLADRGHLAASDLDGRRVQLWNPVTHPYSGEVVRRLAAAGARVDVVLADVIGGGGPPALPDDRFVIRSAGWPAGPDQVSLRLDPPGVTLPLHLVWTPETPAPVVRRIIASLGGS